MPYIPLNRWVISLKVFEQENHPTLVWMSMFGYFFDFVIASGCGFLNMLGAKVTSRFRFLKKYTLNLCVL